jgi:hypothetical protein
MRIACDPEAPAILNSFRDRVIAGVSPAYCRYAKQTADEILNLAHWRLSTTACRRDARDPGFAGVLSAIFFF